LARDLGENPDIIANSYEDPDLDDSYDTEVFRVGPEKSSSRIVSR